MNIILPRHITRPTANRRASDCAEGKEVALQQIIIASMFAHCHSHDSRNLIFYDPG